MNSVQNTPTFSVDGTYIREWLILGPLPSNDMDVDFLTPAGSEEHISPKAGDTIVTSGASLTWQRYQTRGNIVDLQHHFRDALNEYNAIGYLFCLLETEGEGAAEFYFATSGHAIVWLNGKVVHRRTSNRRFTLDADRFEVTLQPGRNRFLIKVSQGEQTWLVSLRAKKLPSDRAVISGIVATEAGTPIANAEVCLERNGIAPFRSRTDASGWYRISISPVDGKYELSATWGDLGDRQSDIQLRPGERRIRAPPSKILTSDSLRSNKGRGEITPALTV